MGDFRRVVIWTLAIILAVLALVLAAAALKPYIRRNKSTTPRPAKEYEMPSVLYETDELGIGINKVSKNGIGLHK